MSGVYDQIGAEALRSVVNDFCDRMFVDPIICFLFAGKNKQALAAKEWEFAARLLGARVKYTGRSLRAAHASSLILEGHFYRRAMILKQTLIDHNVPMPVREAWIAHTFRLQPQIKHAILRRQLPKKFGLFVGTPAQREAWKSRGIEDTLERTWDWVLLKYSESAECTAQDVEDRLKIALAKATKELVHFDFEAAVGTLAGLLEFLLDPRQADKSVSRPTLRIFVVALTAFAPRLTEALWERIDGPGLVYLQRYPRFEAAVRTARTDAGE
jgi:hemoglobin